MASGSITSKCWPHLTHSTEFLLCIAKTEPPHFPRSIDGFGACRNSRAPRTAFASLLHFPVLHQPRLLRQPRLPPTICLPVFQYPAQDLRRGPGEQHGLIVGLANNKERNIGNGERCRLACEESFLNAQERIDCKRVTASVDARQQRNTYSQKTGYSHVAEL